jgi:hypothetical protein
MSALTAILVITNGNRSPLQNAFGDSPFCLFPDDYSLQSQNMAIRISEYEPQSMAE